MVTFRVAIAVVLALLGTRATRLLAQRAAPLPADSDYVIDSWSTDDGLPQSTVTAIVQTRDGYLWLGTFGGLVRFDGVRFTLFSSATEPGMGNDRIVSLTEDRDGALWMGTEHGVIRYADGRFTTFTPRDGAPGDAVGGLYVDTHGALWIPTLQEGLFRFQNGRFTRFGTADGLPAGESRRIMEDDEGTLWVNASTAIARRDPGATRFRYGDEARPAPDVIAPLYRDSNGAVWFSTQSGVARLSHGMLTRYRPPGATDDRNFVGMTQAGEGSYLLLSLATGLWQLRIGAGAPEFRQILPSHLEEWRRIRSLLVDREGTRWIGTDADGLVRLRPRIITVLTSANGLAGDQATGVLIDHRGRVWVGSNCQGFAMLDGARAHRFTRSDGFDGACVWSFAEDRDGSMWVGTFGGGLRRVRDGRVERPPEADLIANGIIFSLFVDRGGALWAGTGGGGITRIENGRATVYDAAHGLPGNNVRVIFQDRDGVMWAGTDRGLARIAPDGHITAWTTAQGLAGNAVRAIYQDSTGTMWIGTYGGGLSRFKNGTFATITTAQGLFENVVSAILEDGDGYFWMSGNRGISRVRRADLDALADGKRRTVDAIAYGRPDGLDPPETNGGFQPAAWKGRDGRLWFPTIKGLAVVDPRAVVSNPDAPSVMLEQVVVDGVRVSPVAGVVRISPSSRNVEFYYTALSSPAPERIRFRYRLVGVDDDWVPAGTRRVAYFTHLPPGSYHFVVSAANRDGVWNTTGASLRLVIPPPVWMTWWFRVLVGLAIAGVIAGVVYRVADRKRRRYAAQQEFTRKLIEGQERERKRIAAELHDSIGQDLLVVKNRAQMGLRTSSDSDGAREQLERISEIVSGTLAETRQIAHNLHPYQLDRLGLTAAIRSALERVADASGIQFTVELDDIDGLLEPEAEINVFRIVQEAANNIMKHSKASEAHVSMRRVDGTLAIRIEDDGRGLSLARGTHHHLAASVGLGLQSIGERLEMLGGSHEIRSAPGAGTRLRATIPIARPSAAGPA